MIIRVVCSQEHLSLRVTQVIRTQVESSPYPSCTYTTVMPGVCYVCHTGMNPVLLVGLFACGGSAACAVSVAWVRVSILQSHFFVLALL